MSKHFITEAVETGFCFPLTKFGSSISGLELRYFLAAGLPKDFGIDGYNLKTSNVRKATSSNNISGSQTSFWRLGVGGGG